MRLCQSCGCDGRSEPFHGKRKPYGQPDYCCDCIEWQRQKWARVARADGTPKLTRAQLARRRRDTPPAQMAMFL